MQRIFYTQKYFEKENQAREFIVPNFKFFYKAVVKLRQYVSGIKIDIKINEADWQSRSNFLVYNQLIFDINSKANQWRKNSLSSNRAGKTEYLHAKKNEFIPSPHTIFKIYPK